MKRTYVVVNGPNLSHLGKREPALYGSGTLADLEDLLAAEANALGVLVEFLQSNHEGSLIDILYELEAEGCPGVVFNPGAYAHTSIALRDAIAGTGLSVVEVHLTNVAQREAFRHHSYLTPVCQGVISGLGFAGYVAALRWLVAQQPSDEKARQIAPPGEESA